MVFGQERSEIRGVFLTAWRKHQSGDALEPLEQVLVHIIQQHPEYQPLLADPDAVLDREFTPEMGQSNPFLHLGMHVALQEQLSTDRPTGIRELHQRLSRRLGDVHQAEHQMMEALGEVLWEAQRNRTPPDEQHYLERVRRLVGRDH